MVLGEFKAHWSDDSCRLDYPLPHMVVCLITSGKQMKKEIGL